jgi:hypothetical protein
MASRHSRKGQATRVEASDSEDGHQSSQEIDILKTAQSLVENVRVSMELDVSIYSNLLFPEQEPSRDQAEGY